VALRYVRRQVAIGANQEYIGYVRVLQEYLPGPKAWVDIPVIDEATGEELGMAGYFFSMEGPQEK
jgi:hypothetical protein